MFKPRMMLIAGALLAMLVMGLAAGLVLTRWVDVGVARPQVQTAAVVREIRSLSELATVQYVIEKVVVEEDVKWYGENRVLLVAHGVVKAGVDFQRIAPEDVEVVGTRVRIRLPSPQLLDAYLDESKTQIIERSTGLLRLFDKDLETVARQHAVMDIRRAAKEAGILAEAEQRAQLQVRVFLERSGFAEVEFGRP